MKGRVTTSPYPSPFEVQSDRTIKGILHEKEPLEGQYPQPSTESARIKRVQIRPTSPWVFLCFSVSLVTLAQSSCPCNQKIALEFLYWRKKPCQQLKLTREILVLVMLLIEFVSYTRSTMTAEVVLLGQKRDCRMRGCDSNFWLSVGRKIKSGEISHPCTHSKI